MQPVDLQPVDAAAQTQRPSDLFLIFAGANIVATTLQIGTALPAMPTWLALGVIAVGSIAGAWLVGALAPIGARYGVPSIVAARAPLGYHGAQLLALLVFLSNFVWIALDNAIAASVSVQLAGGSDAWWAVGYGVLAMLIVLGGPQLVGLADRVAVPVLGLTGVLMTLAWWRMPAAPPADVAAASLGDVLRGVDVVFGYQVSWLLMFSDYSRFTASPRASAWAAFGGLAVPALWFIPLGLLASRVTGSTDPGVMVTRMGLGWWGGALLILASLTTNFVNLYMSGLALKSLWPRASGRATVWIIGGIGAAMSFLSATWLARLADFTLLLAAVFVPVGGVLLAHYVRPVRRVQVQALYPPAGGGTPAVGSVVMPGLVAWALGAVTFVLAPSIGATLPSLLVSVVAYRVGTRATAGSMPEGIDPASR